MILIFILTITIPIFCFDFSHKALSLGEDIGKEEIEVFELWHIETFEGGSVSRANFFKNVALEFEKENKGKLFLIKSIPPENLENELLNGKPDIVSFGFGMGKILLPILKAFDNEYNVREDLLSSGQFNGQQFALPVILSGYCYIANADTSPNEVMQDYQLFVGNNGYTSAKKIYKRRTSEVNNGEYLTQYETYLKFTQGKAKVMLGTARDVFRTQNLIDKGRMTCSYEFVEDYSDLVQYLGITSDNLSVKRYVSKLFDSTTQRKLSSYSLFSTLNLDIYTQSIFNEMETALQNQLFVPNVFKGE